MLQPSGWLYSATGPRSCPPCERRAALEVVAALVAVPAVVDAADAALDVVDLFPRVLADVADPEVAVGAVEGEAPRVAQPERPDLGRASPPGRRTGCPSECRTAGRPCACPRRCAASLPSRTSGVLAVAVLTVLIAAAAAVAVAEVEHPVGPELAAARRCGCPRCRRSRALAVAGPDARGTLARAQLPDHLVPGLVREVDVELAVRRELGMNATESRPRSPPAVTALRMSA